MIFSYYIICFIVIKLYLITIKFKIINILTYFIICNLLRHLFISNVIDIRIWNKNIRNIAKKLEMVVFLN